MASIHRHSSGRSRYWYGKFRGPEGKSVVKSTKATDRQKALAIAIEWEKAARKAEAGSLAEAQARRVVSEIYEIAAGQPIAFVSIEKFFNEWLVKKRQTNAEGTFLRYERTVRSFLGHLGAKAKRSLAILVSSDIETYRESEVADGKNATTCNATIKTSRSALNFARRQGLIPTNPAEAVELLTSDGEERLCFTSDQIKAILEMADHEWRGLTLLGYYVGARLDIVARLQWTNVDLQRNLICYQTNKVRRGKKATIIQCPIHPELRKHLESLHLTKNAEEHLLPTLAKKSKAGKTGLSEMFQELLDERLSHP